MVITDFKVIASAKPKYPELMADNAEETLINQFKIYQEHKESLAKLRVKIIELEKEVKEYEAKYRKLSDLFDITFKQKEIEEIKNSVSMGIINHSDARNL